MVALALYGILKFEDFYIAECLHLVLRPSYEQRFFLLEIFLSVLVATGSAAGSEDPQQRTRTLPGSGSVLAWVSLLIV